MAKNRNSPQKRLFKADSEKFEDVLWISSNNPREAKALLKQYLLSPCFWETDQEISEYQGEMARERPEAPSSDKNPMKEGKKRGRQRVKTL